MIGMFLFAPQINIYNNIFEIFFILWHFQFCRGYVISSYLYMNFSFFHLYNHNHHLSYPVRLFEDKSKNMY